MRANISSDNLNLQNYEFDEADEELIFKDTPQKPQNDK